MNWSPKGVEADMILTTIVVSNRPRPYLHFLTLKMSLIQWTLKKPDSGINKENLLEIFSLKIGRTTHKSLARCHLYLRRDESVLTALS